MIDYRIYDLHSDGKTKLGHVEDMLSVLVNSRNVAFSTVLMDTWYATKSVMLHIESLGKFYCCPMKSNRKPVDDSNAMRPYQRIDSLVWSASELQTGKRIKIRGFPKYHKVKVFRVRQAQKTGQTLFKYGMLTEYLRQELKTPSIKMDFAQVLSTILEIVKLNISQELIKETRSIFEFQKSEYSPSKPPSYEQRMDRLTRIENMCRDHVKTITQALQYDFGTRDPDLIFLADIFPQISHAQHVKKHLKSWMKREKTASGIFALTGQRSYIVNEPLGVIGIMSPFNAPVSLALDPAVDAIAAGNSVIIKISENTPETATLIKKLVDQYFNSEEMAVVTGDSEVSKFFASLPWDKFVFTGGSEVGKRILTAAAKHLVPVILELGGKSPCVILDDVNISEVAQKIMKVRLMNAGQVCIAGDYVLLPSNHLETFVQSVLNGAKEAYPSIIDNQKFTSVIDGRSYNRITGYIDEAESEGCRVIQSNPINEDVPDKKSRKIPLTLIVNPAEHLQVSKNEVFGPILSIYTYEKLEFAIEYINSKPKPLALYIFGKNKTEIDKVIHSTSSGGVTVNDLLMHVDSKEMGFGGVGYSGMGRYKGGLIGYKAFSNPKSVVEQGLVRSFTERFIPPIKSSEVRKILRRQVGLKN